MKIELLDIVRFYILIILKKKCIFNFEHRKKNSTVTFDREIYIRFGCISNSIHV